jgi:hypothetical protein
METNYVNGSGSVCASGSHRRTLPEAELWTQVIIQAINDLDGRTSLTPGSAKDSARQWFASESHEVSSFIWTCQIINLDPDFIRSRLAKKHLMKKSDEVMPYIAEGAKLLRGKDSRLRDNVDRAQRAAFKRLVA